MAILSRSVEEVGEKGAVRHHVIFSIRVTKMKARADSVPTLIAQTKKGNERQILKTVRRPTKYTALVVYLMHLACSDSMDFLLLLGIGH